MVEVIGKFTKIQVSINDYLEISVYGISNYEAKYRISFANRKTGLIFDAVDVVIPTHEDLIYARGVKKGLVPDFVDCILKGDCVARLYNYSTGIIDDEKILSVAKPLPLWLLAIPVIGVIAYFIYKKYR